MKTTTSETEPVQGWRTGSVRYCSCGFYPTGTESKRTQCHTELQPLKHSNLIRFRSHRVFYGTALFCGFAFSGFWLMCIACECWLSVYCLFKFTVYCLFLHALHCIPEIENEFPLGGLIKYYSTTNSIYYISISSSHFSKRRENVST